MKIFNKTQNRWVGEVETAWSFLPRLKGLLFAPPRAEGLWIKPCSSIHMLGMRHPLDVVFLDRELRVVKIARRVAPFNPLVACNAAHSVLEFFTGRWEDSAVKEGDLLKVE
jgi:hypothetical protein